MVTCFKKIASDTECRAVVLSGAGKIFTAGKTCAFISFVLDICLDLILLLYLSPSPLCTSVDVTLIVILVILVKMYVRVKSL